MKEYQIAFKLLMIQLLRFRNENLDFNVILCYKNVL
jgi:hypothetical protein